MTLHEISIQMPTKSQLAKMRSGQPFRISHGYGLKIAVDMSRLKSIGNKFAKGKAHTMQFLEHEMAGNGIFGKKADDWMKKNGIKSAAYAIGDVLKPMVHAGIDAGAAALSVAQPEMLPFAVGGASALKSYIDKPDSFQPKEIVKQHVNDQVNQAVSPYMNQINQLNNEYGSNIGFAQNSAKAQLNNSALNSNLASAMNVMKSTQLNSPLLVTGMSGPQSLNEVMSVPNVYKAPAPAHRPPSKKPHSTAHGHGLYVGMNGKGLGVNLSSGGSLAHELIKRGVRAYRGQGLHAKRYSKIYEKGSISAGGSVFNQQSLSSQPYLENFVSASYLPPRYQSFHTTVSDSRV